MAQKHDVLHDSVPLMKQLAQMAGLEDRPFRKMVLVLEYDKCPVLFTEGLIHNRAAETELIRTKLLHEEDCPHIDTTSMLNETFRTGRPLSERAKELRDMEESTLQQVLSKWEEIKTSLPPATEGFRWAFHTETTKDGNGIKIVPCLVEVEGETLYDVRTHLRKD